MYRESQISSKIEFWLILPNQPCDKTISRNDIKNSPSALNLEKFKKVRKFQKKENLFIKLV